MLLRLTRPFLKQHDDAPVLVHPPHLLLLHQQKSSPVGWTRNATWMIWPLPSDELLSEIYPPPKPLLCQINLHPCVFFSEKNIYIYIIYKRKRSDAGSV
jgi:hypothetical protein